MNSCFQSVAITTLSWQQHSYYNRARQRQARRNQSEGVGFEQDFKRHGLSQADQSQESVTCVSFTRRQNFPQWFCQKQQRRSPRRSEFLLVSTPKIFREKQQYSLTVWLHVTMVNELRNYSWSHGSRFVSCLIISVALSASLVPPLTSSWSPAPTPCHLTRHRCWGACVSLFWSLQIKVKLC